MIVSYKWLQKYFKDPLPAAQKVAEAFTFGAFEVEGVEEIAGDTAIDLKVLPDRACYALSHRGVAYELSAITGQKTIIDLSSFETSKESIDLNEKVSVTVTDSSLCPRYCARYIKNVEVGKSPEWLSGMLEVVGQRSINTVVDATNFVMLDVGQPLHAFDADKVQGGITVRLAKSGETIELLPEKNSTANSRIVTLQDTDLVIADDVGPIAIAGVKGGLRASVTESTKNLIIESANFDAVSVRKTSTRLALRNDASKRFENNLSVNFAQLAIEDVTTLIKKLSPKSSVGGVTDVFSGVVEKKNIKISADFISARLGVKIDVAQLENIFSRLQIAFEKKDGEYVLTIPAARLDLVVPEDMVEEVGRIYGYDKIPPAIPAKVAQNDVINQTAYWIEKIKDALFGLGFSEVQTSSFSMAGEVEIQNPLASDKNFLRKNLSENLLKSLEQNGKNAALFGNDEVKMFEVGTVFNSDGEYLALGLCAYIAKNMKKKDQVTAEIINKAFESISSVIGKKIETPKLTGTNGMVGEINLSELLATLPVAKVWDIKTFSGNTKYKPFSAYPFMVRDVAVFVPSTVSEKEVSEIIISKSGELVVRHDLFDVFTKKFENGEEKTSYAFHIVFQSQGRTLVEDEVNAIMKNVSDALAAKNWQVR